MKFLLTIASIALLCSCMHSTTPKQPDQPDPKFRTTQPSRLYFKNMRSYYYQQSTQPSTRIDLYNLKKHKPYPIQPIIADNWMQDEAYILLECHACEQFPDTLLFRKSTTQESSDTYTYAGRDPYAQLALANWLFDALQAGHKIELRTINQEWVPILQTVPDRSAFLHVMKDYLRLIEKI